MSLFAQVCFCRSPGLLYLSLCLLFKVNLAWPGGSVWLVLPLGEESIVLLPKEVVNIVTEDAELW